MKNWPRSAYVFILVLTIFFTVVTYWIYVQTRSSYRAVGVNDGEINQRMLTAERIRELVPLADCEQLQTAGPLVELINVKAESINMQVVSKETVRFCEWR